MVEITFFNQLLVTTQNLFYLFILMSFLPYVLQIIIGIFLNVVKRALRFDIAPILDLVAVPGALLKNLPLEVYFRLRGWEMRTSFFPRVNSSVSQLGIGSINGVMFSKSPGRDPNSSLNMYDALFIMLNSYLMIWILYLWMLNFNAIFRFVIYFGGPTIAYYLMVFLTISILLGGLPSSKDTMVPIKLYFQQYPHMVFAIIFNFFGSVILNSIWGSSIAITVFWFMTIFDYILQHYMIKRLSGTNLSGIPVIF